MLFSYLYNNHLRNPLEVADWYMLPVCYFYMVPRVGCCRLEDECSFGHVDRKENIGGRVSIIIISNDEHWAVRVRPVGACILFRTALYVNSSLLPVCQSTHCAVRLGRVLFPMVSIGLSE